MLQPLLPMLQSQLLPMLQPQLLPMLQPQLPMLLLWQPILLLLLLLLLSPMPRTTVCPQPASLRTRRTLPHPPRQHSL
jgi:hypothetical protein